MRGTYTLTDIFNAVQRGNLNARIEHEQTPLIWASSEGYTEIALALIRARVDLDAQNDSGNTALIRAACEGRTEIALALIAAGAKLDIQNKNDYSALILAKRRGNMDIYEALIKAGADQSLKTVDQKTHINVGSSPKQQIWPDLSGEEAQLQHKVIDIIAESTP